MGFDLEAAREKGTEKEIAEYLSKKTGFDLESALKKHPGSIKEINQYLSTKVSPSPIPQPIPIPSPQPQPIQDKTIGDDSIGMQEAGQLIKEGVFNIPQDIPKFTKTMLAPLTRPVETAESIYEFSQGVMEKLYPGLSEEFEGKDVLVDKITEHYMKKRGSLRGILEDFAENPLDVLQDASDVITLGGTALSALPGKTGKFFGKVGRVGRKLDVVSLIGKGAQFALRKTGKIGKAFIGQVLTGVGQRTIEEQFKRTPLFVKALKGEKEYIESLGAEVDVTISKIVNNSDTALKEVAKNRRTAYTEQLEQIQRIHGNNPIGFQPIQDKLNELLKRFNLRPSGNPQTPLIFSESNVGLSSQSDIKHIYEEVINQVDTTPIALDNLKQRLDDFYTEGSKSSVFIKELRDTIKLHIESKVKEYSALKRNYEQATEVIDSIKDGLSLKPGKSGHIRVDTAMRKLISAMKKDKSFEGELLRSLENLSGIDLASQVAGVLSRKITPQGLIGKVADMHLIYAGIMNADPLLGSIVLSSSPVLVAKFMNILGKAYRTTRAIGKTVEFSTPALYRAGKIGGLAAQEKPETVLEE